MPRTGLACSSPERKEIDRALARGESFRNIAKRFGISPLRCSVTEVMSRGRLRRHRSSARRSWATAFSMKCSAYWRSSWDLLGKMESEGDTGAQS